MSMCQPIALMHRALCRVRLPLWLAVMLCLKACAPAFNWREIPINPPGITVLMPDKPSEMTRKLPLGEHQMTMHMTGARVDERMFTVTVGDVEGSGGLSASLALERMEQAMMRNIQGKPLSRETGEWVPGVTVVRLKAQGEAQGSAIIMWAWFFQRGQHVVQAVVMGKPADEEHALTFLQSLKLRP